VKEGNEKEMRRSTSLKEKKTTKSSLQPPVQD